MICLANQMPFLPGAAPQAPTPQEQTALQRRIEATDRQMESRIYELYALTEEEIGIMEGEG